MEHTIAFDVTWPPLTGNDQYGTTQHGKRFLKNEVHEWRFYVREMVLRRCGLIPPVPYEGRLGLIFICNPPHNRGYDLDNISKVLGDCLEVAGLIKNDKNIIRSLGVKDIIQTKKNTAGSIKVFLGPFHIIPIPGIVEMVALQNQGVPTVDSPIPNPPQVEQCPHGEDPAECNSCMVDADLRFDADRENRFFGRD